MYAVIETGGKQYRVEVGTELEVELLDAEPGKTIMLERVLLVADGDESSIGRPLVADATVSAEVVSQIRGVKTISFKYRPKARSRVKKGHRQDLMVLRIADITLNGKSAAKTAQKAADDAKTERERLAEVAAAQAAKDAELAAKLEVGAKKTTAAKAGAAETTTKATTKAKAETKSKTEAKPKADAKASTTAAKPKADAKAKTTDTATTKAAPKRSTSKADATDAKADAPKKARTTKKDE
jgi:large subunit ribosomal protein L21